MSQFSDSNHVLKKVKNKLKTIEHSYLNGSARNIETFKKLTKNKMAMGDEIDMFKFQYLVNQMFQIMKQHNAIYLQHLQKILENMLITKQQDQRTQKLTLRETKVSKN